MRSTSFRNMSTIGVISSAVGHSAMDGKETSAWMMFSLNSTESGKGPPFIAVAADVNDMRLLCFVDDLRFVMLTLVSVLTSSPFLGGGCPAGKTASRIVVVEGGGRTRWLTILMHKGLL